MHFFEDKLRGPCPGIKKCILTLVKDNKEYFSQGTTAMGCYDREMMLGLILKSIRKNGNLYPRSRMGSVGGKLLRRNIKGKGALWLY